MKYKNFQRLIGLFMALAMTIKIFIPSSARATGPLYVTPTGDDNNDCLSPGTSCATINGAISKAASDDTINVAIGTYTDSGADVVLINKNITLLGGWDTTFTSQSGSSTIDGQNTSQGVFVNGSSLTVSLDRFTVKNGYGGVTTGGNVTITNSSIQNNGNDFVAGGGIYNNGASSSLTLINVTVSGNWGYDGGGIKNNGASLTLINTTVADNLASGQGGGIYSLGGSVSIQNSILGGNSTNLFSPDCYFTSGSLILTGNNIISNSSNCYFTAGNGDQLDVDPMLDAFLLSQGYYPLLPGSPAIDAGDDASCSATDQRGVTRPQGSHCDIGAYEYIPNLPPTNISLSNNTMDENQPVGTTVGTLSTTDPNAGDTFTYSFCGGADDGVFSITGSVLKTASVFDFETKLSYSICIRSTDGGGLSTTKAFTVTVNNLVDIQTFEDVPSTYWAWQFIERLYNAGITGGCSTSPLNYCPESEVTRAQMAVFLERGLHYPASFTAPNVAPTFSDTVGHWAEDWIEALKNDGITSGCATELYCPEAPVTRAQMAVFLLRAKYGSSYTPPVVGAGTGFDDVPTDHWAAGWIKQLVAEGITSGCGGGNYCPEAPVTRAQMAVFLVRTFSLP